MNHNEINDFDTIGKEIKEEVINQQTLNKDNNEKIKEEIDKEEDKEKSQQKEKNDDINVDDNKVTVVVKSIKKQRDDDSNSKNNEDKINEINEATNKEENANTLVNNNKENETNQRIKNEENKEKEKEKEDTQLKGKNDDAFDVNDNIKKRNENKEDEEKEEIEDIVENACFVSANNVIDGNNKIEYIMNKDKDPQTSKRQELIMKEKEIEESKKKYSNNNINNTNNISERNRVVNDYINVLEDKTKKKEPKEEEEGEDEFAKAEATYKFNKYDFNYISNSDLKSKLFYTSKDVVGKNDSNPSNKNFSLTLKHPEVLYILENKYQKRLQTLRRITKANENMPTVKNMNEEKERSLSSSSKSPFTSKKAQLIKLSQKEKLALQCLNDSKNPYSKLWIDKILMNRYKSKIQVKGFLNAIPQLKLQKIKEVLFPNVSITYNNLFRL